MKLAGEAVAVILTEEGRDVLGQILPDLPDSNILEVEVRESEDLGVWIEVEIGQRVHFLLVRWEYILLVDVTKAPGRLVGLKG